MDGHSTGGGRESTPRPLLSREQLADRWEITTRTLDRMRQEGYELGEVRVGGSVRFRLASVEQIEAAGGPKKKPAAKR